MLPTSPTSITKTIPSYLYFEYQDDPDLPALISAYNQITQNYVSWFNSVNLPIYTGLTGALLDWIGLGVYGYARPQLSTYTPYPLIGATSSYPLAAHPIAYAYKKATSSGTSATDDIYKRCLTWNFYKGDGFQFSIPWLKKRVHRFIYGVNGSSLQFGFTPEVSITISRTTTITAYNNLGPTASQVTGTKKTSSFSRTSASEPISSFPTINISLIGVDTITYNAFVSAVNTGAITFPFQYTVNVTN